MIIHKSQALRSLGSRHCRVYVFYTSLSIATKRSRSTRVAGSIKRLLYCQYIYGTLWGSESWALIADENRSKLETCHHS
jgi:hypothetical protein